MDLIKELNKEALQKETANVQVGDTVRVHVKVKEGSRERIQVFEGTVIAKKHGGIEETVTVRRVSYGIGVEKVFPVHSPSIDHFEIVRNGKVRIYRDDVVIFDGNINNLKRFKDDVKEVAQGYECGISVENFSGFKENDEIEAYVVEEKHE